MPSPYEVEAAAQVAENFFFLFLNEILMDFQCLNLSGILWS